jgi:hypothetical protein
MCSLVDIVDKFSNDFHVVQSENRPRHLNNASCVTSVAEKNPGRGLHGTGHGHVRVYGG